MDSLPVASRVSQRGALIIAVTLAVVSTILAWWTPLDAEALNYTEKGLARALKTFAAARGIEGVLRLLESGTVGWQLVFGVQAHPAAFVAPLREMLEHFSTLMLFASVSFAVQEMLLKVTSTLPVSIVLSIVTALWLWAYIARSNFQNRLAGLMIFLLLLRLVVPVGCGLSLGVERLVLADEYEQSQQAIDAVTPDSVVVPSGSGYFDRLKHFFANATDFNAKIKQFEAKVQNAIMHIARLSAVFVLQTLILPLLWLWGVVLLSRRLVRSLHELAPSL